MTTDYGGENNQTALPNSMGTHRDRVDYRENFIQKLDFLKLANFSIQLTKAASINRRTERPAEVLSHWEASKTELLKSALIIVNGIFDLQTLKFRGAFWGALWAANGLSESEGARMFVKEMSEKSHVLKLFWGAAGAAGLRT